MEWVSHAWPAGRQLPSPGRSLGVLATWCLLLTSPPTGPASSSWSLAGPRGVGAQTHACHPDCELCHLFDYDQKWHCLLCNPGFELWVDGCIRPCVDGNYRYGYECHPCTYNCKECVGSMRHECTVCKDGYDFDFRRVCVKTCDEGHHASLDGRECQPCNAYCKTCLAGYRISCTSCFAGYSFRVINPNTSSGECMQTCPVGYYRDASNDMRCIQCRQYCDECDALERCQRCWDNATLYRGLCYVEPDFLADAAIDFEAYMSSGQGMVVDINDPSKPDWERMFDSGRRLYDETPTCKDGQEGSECSTK